MYQGKRKNKSWTIQEKNEIVLLYLDGHMGRTEILNAFNIKGDAIFQSELNSIANMALVQIIVDVQNYEIKTKEDPIHLKPIMKT